MEIAYDRGKKTHGWGMRKQIVRNMKNQSQLAKLKSKLS